MEVIYKSRMPGVSDKEFELNHTDGLTTYISYNRLMGESIGVNLRKNERVRGMKIDKEGITFYLEVVK